MKRFIACLTLCLLVLGLMAGCTKPQEPTEATKDLATEGQATEYQGITTPDEPIVPEDTEPDTATETGVIERPTDPKNPGTSTKPTEPSEPSGSETSGELTEATEPSAPATTSGAITLPDVPF